MSEKIWQGEASHPAELADEIEAMKTTIVRLPYVEPIEVVTITMSIANRDLVTAMLRGDVARLSASEVACYRWPEDTTEHHAMRAAFMDGAAHIGAGGAVGSERGD